jgi:acyl-coenzyme A synthetase/AMP-(fatty) acid ligase
MPIKPGSIGRAIPGHVAAIVNDAGEEQPPGTIGNIAFRSPDPVMMLEYWRNPQATRDKYANGLSPAISAAATTTATFGSRDAPTMSSPAAAIASVLRKLKMRSHGTLQS